MALTMEGGTRICRKRSRSPVCRRPCCRWSMPGRGKAAGAALAALLPDFRLVEEHSLTEGMAAFVPIYKVLDKLPAVRNISNKIIVLERA